MTTTHDTHCTGCAPTTRRVQHICQADKCRQGRTACPVPQACEVADATDAGHPGSEAGCMGSVAGLVLMFLACIVFAALVIDMVLRG